jgi:predicted DNA-binding transcriptional regulator AlpA
MEELPRFIGDLEQIRVIALARLMAAAPVSIADELVGIEEASRRLNISKSYLYRHSGQFPFARRIGRKLVFSSLGIDRYIAARR